jgi:predicted ribosomally synthesized peptide with SipW-like signal peptide
MEQSKGRTRKVLATMLVLGLVAGLATIASFAAFSSTTENSNNDFDAGTVWITDNDGGADMLYDLTNQKPDDSKVSCIKVTYQGTLDAAVSFYGSAPGTFGDYVNLVVEEGTSDSATFPNCGVFTPTATLYSGELDEFATDNSDYGSGLATVDQDGDDWQNGDTQVYRFTVTLQDDNAANGESSGPLGTDPHSFTWEAQNI